MRARNLAAAAMVTAAVGIVVSRRRRGAPGPARKVLAEPRSGWHAVTVNRGRDAVLPGGRVPAPLTAFGQDVEVEARPAPGDRGTELRARFRGGAPDARGRLRAALREAKQLIEVGEVLRVDPVPHGRRKTTPTDALVDVATRRSNEEGVL
ncbi:hypothetical protein [Curtobacterium flaccumfaciens]|uniref:hypothetical protein n=1 Tax=Curtobacterium flaccumfaciens TaxID=2035 RepID=UPI0012E08BFC|nr:hypothetical protein [Curtobacterium flaccumfaciens]